MWVEAIMSQPYVYPLVTLLVFIDALVPAFPSEVVLNVAGAWSGAQGTPDFWTLFLWVLAGGIVGDNVCYLIGTRLVRFVDRLPPESAGGKAVRFVRRNMRKRAGATIIAARFIPWARWVATILLGSVRYPWFMFFFFDTLGVIVWALIHLGAGYAGGLVFQEFPLLGTVVGVVAGTLVGVFAQKLQNRFFEWRDVRRGFAEA